MRFFLSSFVNVPELACCRRSDGGKEIELYALGNKRRPPSFLVNLSSALSVLSERQEQAIPELVQYSYHAQDCKNALMKKESCNGTKVKTVGVSSVKMPMRVILH